MAINTERAIDRAARLQPARQLEMRGAMRKPELTLGVGIPLVLMIGCVATGMVRQSSATPPKSVTDVESCLAWLKQPGRAWRITSGEDVYYQVWGPTGVPLPSGPSGYTFDSRGNFIDWSPDVGDIATPPEVFAPGAIQEEISLEELRRRF
jgi:hypothetical protein